MSTLPVSILVAFATPASRAQPVCPIIHFQNVASASLSPSATTRLNLVRQSNGSYTSYETANSAPYGLVSVSPNLGNQLTSCLPAAAAAQNPAPVAPANPVGAPSQAQAVALLSSGDYLIISPNASGGIDAVVFNPQMNVISVQSYAAGVGLGPLATVGLLEVADVNGDGIPDIIYVTGGFVDEANQQPSQVTILLGKGGSSFQSPISYPIGSNGGLVTSFAIGDLNGDHKLDIAAAITPLGGDGGSIVTLLGNGDGTFQAGPVTAIAPQTGSVALADLNGDGKLDLAVAVDNSVGFGYSVAVALGNGDATFATPSYTQVFGGSIAIGDMNNDGIPDIVTIGTILFGDGKGAFPTRQDYYVNGGGAVILTDFNGDGRMDVLIAGGTPALLTGISGSTITVLFGLPDGTFFGPAVSVVPGLEQPDLFISDLHSADFNGDGIPDLVYAGSLGIGVMLGKGDGTFASSFTSAAPPGWELATGDFKGNGNQDIVTVYGYQQDQPGTLTFFAGNGDGAFQAPLTTSIPSGPVAVVSGDFNDDGNLDVAVLFSTGNGASADAVIIYLGNGDGSFRQGASYPAGPDAIWMLTGDLNNGGKPDLVITNSGAATQTGAQIGNVTTLLGKGDGTFVQGTQVPLAVSGGMSLADFNQDGKLDLAVTLDAGNTATGFTAAGFAVLLGKGDGTFQAPLINPLPADSIVAADVNGDGIPDLMLNAQLNINAVPALCYVLGNGDGSFQPPVSLNLNPGQVLLIADVNLDGKPDLVSLAPELGFFSLLNLTTGLPPFRVVSSASFPLDLSRRTRSSRHSERICPLP
jgi:hypothetical protein